MHLVGLCVVCFVDSDIVIDPLLSSSSLPLADRFSFPVSAAEYVEPPNNKRVVYASLAGLAITALVSHFYLQKGEFTTDRHQWRHFSPHAQTTKA